jgi:hypothetical protein
MHKFNFSKYAQHFVVAMVFLLQFGLIKANPTSQPSNVENQNTVTQSKDSLSNNSKYGDVIWGALKVGMTVEEVLAALPGSIFDDQWSSGGMVGVMAEAGILAANKIKVTAPLSKGPFNSESTLYVLFDEKIKLDGVVIYTKKGELPEKVMANYGILGFYLPEFKDAAKMIIKDYAIPELGKRVGPPKFGKERLDSIGSIGVGKSVGGNVGLGVGFSMGSISPASIGQKYERDGYRSMLVIRTVFLGTYNVYSSIGVFMAIQSKTDLDEIEDIQ